MYTYTPPKSSVWGHGLRKMAPARQKKLFDEFLRRCVAGYEFCSADLIICEGDKGDSSQEVVQQFERVLGIEAKGQDFGSLTEYQFERCLNELLADDRLRRKETSQVLLSQHIAVNKWCIESRGALTGSRITMHYGSSPRITMMLSFQDLEDFHYVQRVLAELGLCKLNEKHLKGR